MRLVLLTTLLGIALATPETYEGHKVFRCTPCLGQLELLQQFEHVPGFDFWNEPHRAGDYLDVMVSPEQQPNFLAFLSKIKVNYTVTFENVQELIDAEARYQETVPKSPRAISFTTYNRHSVINSYLESLASSYPNLVTLETIGQSYEGRDLVVIKISSGGSGTRPVILIDAGIHAREWIAPAMALYIINQLVENNAANSGLTDAVDWYILPVLNPDGYEYSHTSSRMWRKTRSPTSSSSCRGVDGNRNFDFHWMETGASSYPCDETYAGSKGFSEPETQAIRDFALANKSKIKLYLTFHSYGNYLLYPWGYTSSLPSDWRTLQALAEDANAAHVSAGGSSYSIGSSTNVLYAAAGGSDDYMKGVGGIALSYTVELTNTAYGFQLPASQIQTTVTRFFAAIRVFGNYVKNNF
ncbi:carboxypeptidase B-like [Periplaneta americana]|uniref:carboxypeptidase B-like n=1 Tax=Periplaneta americana TaxID=6978 RepID=UPI0037E7CEC0